MPIGYNPWGVPNQGAPQIEQPKRIGDCIGFTNSDGQNYYDPYSNYRDYYGYNMYNSYFNPYEMEKRREEEQKRQRELALSKIRFQESLDRSSCAYKGVDVYIPTAEEQLEMAEEKYNFILEYQSIKQRHEQFEFRHTF